MNVAVGKSTSIGLVGGSAINRSATTVTASIAGSTTSVAGAGLSVLANADEPLLAVAVAATVGVTAAAGGSGAGVNLTGLLALAGNETTGTLTAEIDGAAVTIGTSGVEVSAYAGPDDRTIVTSATAASIAVTANQNNASVSGTLDAAVVLVDLDHTVNAQVVGGASVTTTGAVQVQATSPGTVTSTAVAASISVSATSGGSGVGLTLDAAVVTNTVTDAVTASVLQSGVTGTAVTISASSSKPIVGTAVAVALTIAVGTNSTAVTVGGSGAVVVNDTTGGLTQAHVGDAGITATSGDLSITATSGTDAAGTTPSLSATAVGVTGSIGVGGGGTAVSITLGAAVATNTAKATTAALVDAGADLCAGTRGPGSCAPIGQVIVTATESGKVEVVIVAVTLGVAVGKGVTVSIAAAVGTNTLTNTVTATVSGVGTLVRAGTVTIGATANNSITATTVAVSIGVTVNSGSGLTATVTIGAAVSLNAIADTITAGVDAATVSAGTGGVSVSASTGGTNRTVTTTAVAASLTASVAGSVTSANIGVSLAAAVSTATLSSTVHADITGGASITSAAGVTVQASSAGATTSKVGAGTLTATIDGSPTVAIAIAAAVAVGTVDDDVRALVSLSAITGQAVTIGAVSSTPVAGTAVALALGVAVADKASITLTGAGSEVRNTVGGTTTARVTASLITAGGTLSVTAASGAARGSTAVTMSAISASVTGSLTVSDTGADIGVSVAVALGSNTWSTTTAASVDSASNLCAGGRAADGTCSAPAGAVTIGAYSNESHYAGIGAGSLSIGVGQAGGALTIGVALATNTSTGSTTSTVDASTVVGGSVAVTAEAGNVAKALAISLALTVQLSEGTAVGLTGNGASATNTTGGMVTATVSGGSVVTAAGTGSSDVIVSATGLSSLDANGDSGSLNVAGSSAGLSLTLTVDVGLASNTLTTAVTAQVTGSTIDAARRVKVLATGDRADLTKERLVGLAVAVAVSVAFADPEDGIGIGISGAGTSVVNTNSGSVTASVTGGSTVTANGANAGTDALGDAALQVAAVGTTTTSTSTVGVSAALSEAAVALGVTIATTTLIDSVNSAVDGSTLSATAGGVGVGSSRTADAETTNVVVSIALLAGVAGAGAQTTSSVGGTSAAHIRNSATVSAVGAVTVQATTAARASADTRGGGGAVLNIDVMFSTATVSATTDAQVNASTVSAGSVAVVATRGGVAGQVDTTYAGVIIGSFSFLAGAAGSQVTALDNGLVQALLTGGAVVNAAGAVLVTATATTSTTAVNQGGAGSLVLAISVGIVGATHSADTTAAVGPDTGITAGSLTVLASAVTPVTANVFTLGIGLFTGAGAGVIATSSGAVTSSIGTVVGGTAPVNPRPVTVGGAVTVAAQVEQTASTTNGGGAAGAVAVGAIVATAVVSGTSRAYLGDGTRLSAGALTIQVTDSTGAGARRSAAAATTVGAAGIVAGAGSSSTAIVDGSIEAFIGADATVLVGGATTVQALGAATATADAKGGSGGGVAVSVFFATACVSGYTVSAGRATCSTPAAGTVGTRAYMGAGTTLTTGSLQVLANATDTATATVLAVAVAIVGGAGGDANAAVDSDVQSFLGTLTGASTTTIAATGAVNVVATASQTATGTNTGGAGGGIAVGWLNATTSVSSSIDAVVGSGVTIGSAGSVQVRAETANADASSNVTVGGGAAISVSGTTSSATSNPTITATVGDGARIGSVTPVALDVTITAIGRSTADAVGNAYAGGLIVVAPPHSVATLDPTVQASVGSTSGGASTTSIAAAGSISLTARLQKDGTTYSDLLGKVDLATDTAEFNYPVGEGTQVMYSANGGQVLSGLHDRSVYTLLSGGTSGLIRFGSLFSASNVDPTTDTISFLSGHGYRSGDCIWYDPRGGSSIIGAGAAASSNGCGTSAPPVPGARAFFVRVLDPYTIGLTTTYAAATATDDAPIVVTPVDGTHVSVPGTAVSTGDQVVYRAPLSVSFTSAFVDVDLVQRTVNGTVITVPNANADGSTIHNPAANNLYLGSAVYAQLNSGDALTYTLVGSGGSIGLATGTTYYAIKSGDGYTIRFAPSYCQAVGEAGDPGCAGIAILAVDLTLSGPDSVAHQLDRGLGQLVDGRVYWVTSFDPDTGEITLGATLGGPALSLDATHRPGTHRIGINEIDLVAPTTSGQQALIAAITTPCAATCGRLLAPSGQPLSTIAPPANDGTSNAVATGGTGALADFPFPRAELTGTPSVSATAAGILNAGRDVTVVADSTFVATSYADTASGGLISVGNATSSLKLTGAGSPTAITLAGSITAGGNLTAATTIDHSITSTARSVGGGLVAVKVAYSNAWLDDDATVTVAPGATLTAGGALALSVGTNNTGSSSSNAYSGSAGGAAAADDQNNPDRGLRIGSAGKAVQRSVEIGAGSTLTGRTVSLAAETTGVYVSSDTQARAYAAFYAQAFANSNVDFYADTHVLIHGPNTTISGTGGVDIIARGPVQAGQDVGRNGFVQAGALIPPQRLSFEGTDSFLFSVTAEQGVTVISGARGPSTSLAPAGPNTALYVFVTSATVNRTFDPEGTPDLFWGHYDAAARSGTVNWDADVIVLGGRGGTPLLDIGPDGTVLAANNVLIDGVAPVVGSKVTGPISVSPIATSGGGDVLMAADDFIRNLTGKAGDWPLFEWRTTAGSVTITNRSPFALTIGGIDVVGAANSPDPLVQLRPANGAATGYQQYATLQFDVRRTVGSSYVDIEQRSPAGADLVIAGPINNPLGLTRLVNFTGSITGTGLITTNQLDVDAPDGSIGTSAAPLPVDLVRFASTGPFVGPPAGTVLDPRLLVEALGDVYLSLRGVDRADPAATSMTLYLDAIAAGRQAVVVLRTGLAQTVAAGGGTIDVQVVNEQTQWVNPIAHACHFRGGNSSNPAVYDAPCPVPPLNGPDPSVPTGPGTAIATTVSIGQRNVVLPRVQAPGGASYQADRGSDGAYTLFGEADAPPNSPGVVSNGMTLVDSAGAIDPNQPTNPAPWVTLVGFMDPDRDRRNPYGRLDVSVAGDITLTATGNVTVGYINSREGDIDFTAFGKIVDDPPQGLFALLPPAAVDSCDYRGFNVTITAAQIGGADNFVEVCLRDDQPARLGGLAATATTGLFIDEVEGDLRLKSATVTAPDLTLVNDLTLTTTNGSILDFDADADAAADVKGNRIVLAARGVTSTIGTVDDAIEIDSSTAGVRSGWVYANAGSDIKLTEISGPLLVLGAQSDTGLVLLDTPDTTGPDLLPDVDGYPYRAETIELLVSGSISVTQGLTTTVGPPGQAEQLAGVWAGSGVILAAGDDIRALAGTFIGATGSTIILDIDSGSVDADGGLALLAGSTGVAGGTFGAAASILVRGRGDPDTFVFISTFLGAPTRAEGAGATDVFLVTELQTMDVAAGHTLTLDGQADADRYQVVTTGSEGAARNYVINVLDTGASTDDALLISGADDSADKFLLRTVTAIPGSALSNPAMVTLLPATGTGVQRVNYADTADALTVFGLGGDDSFTVDGATVAGSLVGGAGDDRFTFGQLYGSERTTAAGLVADDVFPTTQTSRGWVSSGPTGPMGVFGDDGDDVFTVNANRAVLTLFGGADDDLFIVRALALAAGGYLARAPVNVDGGTGFDRVVSLGTEFADALYLGTDPTAASPTTIVSGAGTTTMATEVEAATVHGLAGDDTIFVAATAAGMAATVVGGAGSDQFTVTGDLVVPIVGASLDNTFVPADPVHTLSNLAGSLVLDGGSTGVLYPIGPAVLLPGETDQPVPPLPPDPPADEQIDLIDLHDDGTATGREFTLAPATFSWAGAAPGSVGFDGIDVLLTFLGSGDDAVDVLGTPATGSLAVRPTTVIHGGGGADRIVVTGAATGSLLVLYGDTDAAGGYYNSAPVDIGARPSGLRFLISGSVPFAAAGADTIDARGLLDAGVGLIGYGGAGDDVLHGGPGDDLLAGGSGNDLVAGHDGDDIVLGDNGLDVEVLTGAVTLVAAPETPPLPDADPLIPGDDALFGGAGDDVLIGDLALPAGGGWFSVPNGADGTDVLDGGDGNDLMIGGGSADLLIGGEGDDRILGDSGVIAGILVASLSDLPGGDDLVFGGAGSDVILGGTGDDDLRGDAGDDLLVGDDGAVLGRVVLAVGPGGSDTITGGDGNDVVFGGAGNDTIDGGAGDDVMVGDDGTFVAGVVIAVTSEDGGDDLILGRDGNDVLIGGDGDDWIIGGTGNDRIAGDLGSWAGGVLRDPGGAGDDILFGDDGDDWIIGGPGSDLIVAGAGNDVALGDEGVISAVLIASENPTVGAADVIDGGDGNDLLIGGRGDDVLAGGDGNDLIFGDHGLVIDLIDLRLLPLGPALGLFAWSSIFTDAVEFVPGFPFPVPVLLGGDDVIAGGAGDDILIGGQGADRISGGAGDDDLIGGSTLAGAADGADVLDGGAGNDWITGDNAYLRRVPGLPSPRYRTLIGDTVYDGQGIPQLDGSARFDPDGTTERAVQLYDLGGGAAGTFGDDRIAGGAGDDVIFGQLGDDWIAGDAALLDALGRPTLDLTAGRPTGTVADQAGPGSDGDDYIEGNAGDDTIFGGLGQDDLIGGSSGLYGLSSAQRADGRDIIFGGAGTATTRYAAGDGSPTGHSRDADVILGDNGNIYRILAAPGTFARFNYDADTAAGPIKVRAVELLDYTYGGSAADLGDADLIHGEDGDDTIAGMTGNDVLFGDAGDDDVYGGAGSDRIYGGNGVDGLLGDDGLILTSRNGLTEPLNGVFQSVVETIVILDQYTQVNLTVAGELQKQARLFNWTAGGNDVIYGGIGDDFIHGGAGDDAISGAESLAEFYSDAPVLDDNPLHFNPATGHFAAYDPADPRSRIDGFLLNFDAFGADGQPLNDGLDRIFGDNGNDWLVGGTDCDVLFGGWGQDLLQLDDYLETDGGRNDRPEDNAWFRWGDLAYGGGDADILIANTAQDRMFDWDGAFNQYWVPFEYYDAPVVNARYTPAIAAFLRLVAQRAGADPALIPPLDEAAIVTPADAGYPDQFSSAPAGQWPPVNPNGPAFNLPGVERDGFTTTRPGCHCFAIASPPPYVPPVGPVVPPVIPAGAGGSVAGPGGALAATGAGAVGLLPWVLVLLLAGAALVGAGRRRGRPAVDRAPIGPPAR